MKRYLHPHILKLLSTSNSLYTNSYFVCYTIPNFDLGIINDYARIYVLITDKSCNNDNVLFGDLLKLSRTNNEIWLYGIDDFKPGVDYFLNTSLSNYYNNTNPNIVLPDYIYNSSFTNNWLCCDTINFDYYNKLNKLLVSSFTIFTWSPYTWSSYVESTTPSFLSILILKSKLFSWENFWSLHWNHNEKPYWLF